MSLTILALVVLAIGLIIGLVQALISKSRLRQSLHRYDTLADKEGYQRRLESNIYLLESQQETLNTQIKNLQHQFSEIDAKVYLQSIDYYEPKYEFISSEDYVINLKKIKLQQENMQQKNQAYICDAQWTVGDSKRKGDKMINDILKLVELAFEERCSYAIKEVKYNNIDSLKNKINSTWNRYNKLLKTLQCQISQEYLQLKFIELDLQHEFEDKKQQEREIEQEIKKQSKESEVSDKARLKLEEAEKREKLHQQELESLRQQIEQAEDEKQKQLQLQIQRLEEQLAEDRSDKDKAISESRGVKWGYIYIISNIGSFKRDNVFRICMTNRNKPDEYIREMNPIVPFKFDVHYKIFSEDALDTLEKLHQRFADKRVNLENSRREFFKVSIDEIVQAVQQIQKETGMLNIVEGKRTPEAYEYRKTLAARKKYQHLTSDDSYLEEDVIP